MRAEPREAADLARGAARGAAGRAAFLAFLADEASEAALRGALADTLGTFPLRRGDVRVATRALEREATPEVLLVDIAGLPDPLEALEALAAVCTPDVRVLAVGERADIGFYRQLTRDLGVAEYIPKPLTREAVARLFAPLLAGEAADAQASRGGRITAVCGARGGAGATTVAVNLALHLAEASHGHVALLDLHMRGGSAAMMLGARPGTGLRVALEEPDRVDALFLDRAAIAVTERLRLIAAEEPLDAAPRPTEKGVQRLLAMLRHRFNHVVVDLRMPPGMVERQVVHEARHAVLVLPPDVAGIRDALAARRVFSAGNAHVLTVLNRAGMPGMLKSGLIAEGLGGKPDAVIPYLPRQLPRAANLGRPALGDCAALRHALAPLMQEIAALRAPGGSWLRRLLGGRT